MSAKTEADERRITREDTELLELANRAGAATRRYMDACRAAGVPRPEAEGVLRNFTDGRMAGMEPVARYKILDESGDAVHAPDTTVDGDPPRSHRDYGHGVTWRSDYPTEGDAVDAVFRISYDDDPTRLTVVRVDEDGEVEEVWP